MNSKIVKTIIFVGVLGGAAYLLYKYKKDREDIITFEDIENYDKVIVKIDKDAPIVSEDEGIVIETDTNIEEEEVSELRRGTDPNSASALHQYKNMLMADFRTTVDEVKVLQNLLFEEEFIMNNPNDDLVYEAILDDRKEFFGDDSVHCGAVTWAELILYYANRINYDIGGGVPRWCVYIIGNLGITPNHNDDDLALILRAVSEHAFVNYDTGYFGMFGLDDEGMKHLKHMTSRTVHHTYTFEAEFNSFLNMTDYE